MPRYSGPALAAGAISKAIGEMFEGIMAGQQGGLAAEKTIGEQGRAEREMAMKAGTLPQELAALRAQIQLMGAQRGRLEQETEASRVKLPGEVGYLGAQTKHLGAETGYTGAKTDETRAMLPPKLAQAGAETDLTRAQTKHMGAQTGLVGAQTGLVGAQTDLTGAQTRQTGAQTNKLNQEIAESKQTYGLVNDAIADWNATRARAAVENRPLGIADLSAFTNRHPVLLRGADDVPSGMLYNLSEMEAYLKSLQAKNTQNMQLENFLHNVQKSATDEAGKLTGVMFGKIGVEEGGPQVAEFQQWYANAARNSALANVGMANHMTDPGPAPPAFVDYVAKEIKAMFPGEKDIMVRLWTNSTIDLMRYNGIPWRQALANLRKGTEGDAAGPPSGYMYDPQSGSFSGAGAGGGREVPTPGN